MANPHPKPLTADARKAGLERRLTYSRKWYKQQLIAIATAQTTMSGIQFRALLEYGRIMGWYGKARMVRHYTHVSSGAARKAVELLDSDPILVPTVSKGEQVHYA